MSRHEALSCALALAIILPCTAFAQGGGGGGSGGGSAGGGADGAALSGAGGTGTSSPSATNAAGTAGSGPANPAGTVGAPGNSTVGNAPATAQPGVNHEPGQRIDTESEARTRGTNAAGTAASSGSSAAAAQTAPAGGIGRPATTNQQDSDAKIAEQHGQDGGVDLQKLQMSIVLILMLGPFLMEPISASGKRPGSHRQYPRAAEQIGTIRPEKDLWDPTDRALEKIRSICRDC